MEVVMNNEVVPVELDVQPIIAKRRRKKSKSTRVTMKHFTIEAVSDTDRRIARCKKCKKSFIHSIGSIVPSPTHLKRHLGWCLSKEESEKISQLIHSTAPPKIISPKIISRL